MRKLFDVNVFIIQSLRICSRIQSSGKKLFYVKVLTTENSFGVEKLDVRSLSVDSSHQNGKYFDVIVFTTENLRRSEKFVTEKMFVVGSLSAENSYDNK